MGLEREAYQQGRAHRLRRGAAVLTATGLAGTVLVAGRSRTGAVVSGLSLLAGSALQRFGVFEASVATTKDPRFVVPQRERLTAATESGGRLLRQPSVASTRLY